jgi:hypothetical protein
MNDHSSKGTLEIFKPQFGLDNISFVTSALDNISEFANVDIPEHVLKEVEGLTALFFALKDCVSVTQFTSIVFLYVRSHCEKSISLMVINYLKEVFDDGSFIQQSPNGNPAWLDALRNVQQNWALVKGNTAFRQLSKLLGVLVMLGLCDAADLSFDIAGFKLFDTKLLETHMSAFDVADALLSTVTFFAEGVYMCFKQNSIRPLLINDQAALELDEEYALLMSWWDLVKVGNLERICDVSDQEFGRRINFIHTNLSNLVTTLKGLDRKLVNDKLMKIMAIKNDLVTLKISSGTRRAPWAAELFGKSSQGKTTFGDQLLDGLLTSANLPTGKEYRAALNPGDKFMSNWTSDKLVAIIDDMANEKSTFVEKPPTRSIIDICNNQMYYAPKADLESKGKCFVEPELVLVTTNKKDLDAYAYSNCPYSIQRRMDLVFTIKCRDEFQRKDNAGRPKGVSSTKVREHYTVDGVYTPASIDDIWHITIEQAVEPDKLSTVAKYEPITWRGNIMTDVSAPTAIACAIEHFNEHRINQQCIIDAMNSRSCALKRCKHEGCVFLEGMCPEHPFEQQFGLQTVIAMETIRRKFTKRVHTESDSLLGRLDTVATNILYKRCNTFMDQWDWLCLIPESWLDDKYFLTFAAWNYSDTMKSNYKQYVYSMYVLASIMSFFFPFLIPFLIPVVIYQHIYAKSTIKRNMLDELKRRNDSLPLILRKTRDDYAKEICYAAAGIGALYVIARMYKQWKSLKSTQGSLEPTTPEEITQRDSEKSVWATVVKRTLPVSPKVLTTTWQQLETLVEKNLVYGSVQTKNEIMMCNLLFLKTNVVLIPNHYFEGQESLIVKCYKQNASSIGGSFETRLCRASSYTVPDTDLCLCYSSAGGSFKDITDYFPTGAPGNHPFHMVWRSKAGEILSAVGRTLEKRTSNTIATFLGGEYANLSIDTFGGLCGATLISQTHRPQILGFHVGGASGTPKGCFCLLTQQQISDALPHLRKVDGVLLTGNIEKFTPQILGVSILTNEPLHPKSALNYLPEGSQFSYYGSCPGSTSSRSDVRRTPISDIVADVTGVENIWGAPKMKPEWFGWQKCLANASLPGTPFPHDLLATSIADYKKPLVELIRTDLWKTARPLNDHENLCGIPGKKFMDAINLNTSIGYPLNGAKRKFVTELEPTDDKPNNRVLDPIIMDEIARCEDMYARGFRAMTIAKACKKDEVLPVAKEKCRIFYGNPLSLTFLIRKYYLPMLRFLQMNPLLSECAVGINCHGPEWEEFHTHTMKHGSSRLFGGDYGKYDQKLPSQLLIASMRILIDLARECNYSERDLLIMEAMAGDIVYALIAFNGDLVGLNSGTHISGNSLTVILNGISGSLNLRCFFYTRYSSTIAFRGAANMMTYGDDNIGTVDPKYPEFNIKACSEFLATYGQTYTMPDKESELTPYLDEDEFEFLKRESIYHPRLGKHLGALSRKSIYKSLHCYIRGKGHPLTPDEACALNIDTAIREFFNHGKDVYESERVLMNEVAAKAEISHMCALLQETYEDRVDDWYSKYENQSEEDSSVL